jgi:hypothetical protein
VTSHGVTEKQSNDDFTAHNNIYWDFIFIPPAPWFWGWKSCNLTNKKSVAKKSPLDHLERVGESPQASIQILAEIRITGPQWHPTTVRVGESPRSWASNSG